MPELQRLSGQKATKADVISVLDSDRMMTDLQSLLQPVMNHEALVTDLLTFISQEIDRIKQTLEPIDDEDELQYLLAILYTQLKSNWIMYNTKMNYTMLTGDDPDERDTYRASLLTLIIDKVEPLTHPEAVKRITVTLGQTIREPSADEHDKAS
jgi:hypothetical protein